MGRPERPVDRDSGALHDFALGLRELRDGAGRPTYESMARRSGASRTALAQAASGQHLPRWKTVAGYVQTCGGDVEAWRRRWDELDADSGAPAAPAVAAAAPPQPAAALQVQPVAASPSEPGPERRPFPRQLFVGGLLCAAVVVALVVLPAVTAQPRSDDGSGALPAPTAASGITLTDAPGVYCEARPDPAIAIEALSAADGAPGIAKLNTFRGSVLRPPRPGYSFWLMVHLYSDAGNVYVAKAKLADAPQGVTETLQFNDVVGSKRDVYVIEADPVVGVVLERNLATQLDGSLDHERALPPLATIVSPVCFVQKTRE